MQNWASAFVDPRTAMARQMRAGLSDARALAQLLAACVLAFLASLPAALRTAERLTVEVAGAVSAHLFAYLFVAPLLMYAVAAFIHLLARAFGGRGGFLEARAALFGSLLLAAPVALAIALIRLAAGWTSAGALPWLSLLAYAGLGYWLWLLSGALAEAEGFRRTSTVALGLAGGLAIVIAVAVVLLGGGVSAAP